MIVSSLHLTRGVGYLFNLTGIYGNGWKIGYAEPIYQIKSIKKRIQNCEFQKYALIYGIIITVMILVFLSKLRGIALWADFCFPILLTFSVCKNILL